MSSVSSTLELPDTDCKQSAPGSDSPLRRGAVRSYHRFCCYPVFWRGKNDIVQGARVDVTPKEVLTTQWPEELRAATQRLSEASTSVVPQEINWSAVVNHEEAFCTSTGKTQKSCAMHTLAEYGAQWITALKALTRCMNRKVVHPTWKQKQLLETFETYWDDPARLTC